MDELIALLKKLIEPDIESDEVLQFYLENAINSIEKYTGINHLDVKYNNAIAQFAQYLMKTQHMQSVQEGSKRVVNYGGSIPPFIKAMLPYPKIGVI